MTRLNAPPPHPADPLRCEHTAAGVVVLIGEVDLAAHDVVDAACFAGNEFDVTVDLSRVTFLDTGGYSVLLAVGRQLQAIGGTLTIQGACGQPQHLLDHVAHLSSDLAESTGVDADLEPPRRIVPAVWEHQDGAVTVAFSGDLNERSARDAAQTLRRVISGRPSAVCVDLAAVRFVDRSGIRALLIARYLAWELSVTFRCTAAQPSVLQQFREAGIAEALGADRSQVGSAARPSGPTRDRQADRPTSAGSPHRARARSGSQR